MATGNQNSLATVFIVDDDDDARTALERFLKSHGYDTEAFASASAFLHRLPFDGVSCLILDLQMPEMSGLDLQEEQKRLEDQGIIHAIRSRRDLDEAAGAYKDIDEVVENQLDLVEVIVTLKPLAVIKG